MTSSVSSVSSTASFTTNSLTPATNSSASAPPISPGVTTVVGAILSKPKQLPTSAAAPELNEALDLPLPPGMKPSSGSVPATNSSASAPDTCLPMAAPSAGANPPKDSKQEKTPVKNPPAATPSLPPSDTKALLRAAVKRLVPYLPLPILKTMQQLSENERIDAQLTSVIGWGPLLLLPLEESLLIQKEEESSIHHMMNAVMDKTSITIDEKALQAEIVWHVGHILAEYQRLEPKSSIDDVIQMVTQRFKQMKQSVEMLPKAGSLYGEDNALECVFLDETIFRFQHVHFDMPIPLILFLIESTRCFPQSPQQLGYWYLFNGSPATTKNNLSELLFDNKNKFFSFNTNIFRLYVLPGNRGLTDEQKYLYLVTKARLFLLGKALYTLAGNDPFLKLQLDKLQFLKKTKKEEPEWTRLTVPSFVTARFNLESQLQNPGEVQFFEVDEKQDLEDPATSFTSASASSSASSTTSAAPSKK